jgi:prophage DNA circulation protein
MSLVLNVEILGEFKKLTSATQGANKQLKNMGDRSKKISTGINKAFAAIGIGLSFRAISQGFKETTKLAQVEIKGREQLTLAIQNNTSATDEQISGIHDYIAAMEISAAISDDQLRPAFANLVRATGDVTKSQDLMEVALDVSAGTGKSLETVTQAMGRALNGSAVALNRLVPALKNSKNPMKDLAAAFEGANEQASKQKTWERFEIILGNIKEMIGDILLPVLDDFSEWFTTAYPKIQEFFKNLKAAFDEPAVKQSFKDLNDALGRLGTTLRNLFGLAKSSGANDMITFLKTLADVFTVIANVIDRIVKGLKVAMPSLNALGLTGQGTQALAEFLVDNVQRPSLSQIVTPGSQLPTGPGTNNRSGNRTININVNSTNITPKQIVDKIKEAERQTGTRYLVR